MLKYIDQANLSTSCSITSKSYEFNLLNTNFTHYAEWSLSECTLYYWIIAGKGGANSIYFELLGWLI